MPSTLSGFTFVACIISRTHVATVILVGVPTKELPYQAQQAAHISRVNILQRPHLITLVLGAGTRSNHHRRARVLADPRFSACIACQK